ncbi:MAG: hypothetical protein SOW77_07800 [Ruminococcus sp.]|nr:hypothetical protein [Ruminococcus sp.]
MDYLISGQLGTSLPSNSIEFTSMVNNALVQSADAIRSGYENPLSPTGTPMNMLNGAAYTNALLSNIGIPRNQGGTGMYGGLQTLCTYMLACGMQIGFNACCCYHNLPQFPYINYITPNGFNQGL